MKANFFKVIEKRVNKHKDLRESLMELCLLLMRDKGMTHKRKEKLYRLRAWVDINMKDF